MKSDEDLTRMWEDYFSLEAERHRNVMAQGSDILAKISAVGASLDTLKATFDKAMETVSSTVPAGHAAVLETFSGPLDDLAKQILALGAEFESRIKKLPVPGDTPSA